MTDLVESARQREDADFELFGRTPEARQLSARILVNLDRQEGKVTPQWVIDVAEGRLPA